MKKIKISELPLHDSLKGLYTIGTDDQNRSVKVSLEFVETRTDEVVKETQEKATDAISEVRSATNTAVKNAEDATSKAQNATKLTLEAKANTETATQEATTAAETAKSAAESALTVKIDITDMLHRLIPTGLDVQCIKRITVSNVQPVYIKTVLKPTDAIQNIIFISDNRAVFVTQDGRIRVLSEGISTIQIVPVCNTALTKTISIEVGKPFARLNTLKSLRLSSDKAFRLT